MVSGTFKVLRQTFKRPRLAIWAVIAVSLALTGPFGTFNSLTLAERLFYWSAIVVVSAILGRVCNLIAIRVAGPDHPLRSGVLMVILMTLAFTPLLWLFSIRMIGDAMFSADWLQALAVTVAAVSAVVMVTRHALPRRTTGAEEGQPPHDRTASFGATPLPAEPARFARRLPIGFKLPILRLSARDHFIDAVTPSGTCAVRIRFADAVNEMDSVPGFCTHRSHWVAQEAIKACRREGGRDVLLLVNGDVVPVSRKYKPELVRAGMTWSQVRRADAGL